MPVPLPVSILAGLEVRSRLDNALAANRATISPTGHGHITGPSGNLASPSPRRHHSAHVPASYFRVPLAFFGRLPRHRVALLDPQRPRR